MVVAEWARNKLEDVVFSWLTNPFAVELARPGGNGELVKVSGSGALKVGICSTVKCWDTTRGPRSDALAAVPARHNPVITPPSRGRFFLGQFC